MAVNWESIRKMARASAATEQDLREEQSVQAKKKERQRLLHGPELALQHAKEDEKRMYAEMEHEAQALYMQNAAGLYPQQILSAQSGYPLTTSSGPWPSMGYQGYQYVYSLATGVITGPGVATSSIESAPVNSTVIEKLKAVEPRKVAQRMPDSIDMMTGWRAWRTVGVGGHWRLKALGQNTVWEPKKKMVATCRAALNTTEPDSLLVHHPAPFRSCSCGFWAFKNVDHLPSALLGQNHEQYATVIGSIHMWGHVIETDIGFRAEFAYPKELWLLKDGMEELGWIYGVPIRTARQQLAIGE